MFLSLAGLVSDSSAREPQAASRPDSAETANTQADRKLQATPFGGGMEVDPVALSSAGPLAEELTDWADVLELLPKDAAGAVDWVRAVKDGVIAPRPQLPSAPPPKAPYGLDSLAQVLNASGGDSPLLDLKMLLEDDVKLVPEDAPFFEVRFPHSSHMLWLNCSSCHPWILGKRGVGMEAIFDGDYCGKCHGKVSYHPETACSRCHVNLHFPQEELAQTDLAAAGEDPVEATPELVERGRERYETFCVSCHGEEGDGAGDFARFMEPKPRDFTEGTFKFRTTGSGSLPQDIDIYRTITFGVKKSSMPAWFELSSRDRWALVHYVKTFSEYFEEEEPDDPIEIPEPPPVNSELLTLGAEMFAEMQCWDCHGSIGKGDGAAAGTLEDDWGYPIRPADFTQGVFKAGNTIGDIYRTVATGLDGTPMPSFGDIMEAEQLWALSFYVQSLATSQKGFGIMGNVRFPREVGRMDMPAAVFPHWFHRIRFKCTACHPAIFRMESGANPVSMDGIGLGEWCGRCHNGHIAWAPSFFNCNNCHRS